MGRTETSADGSSSCRQLDVVYHAGFIILHLRFRPCCDWKNSVSQNRPMPAPPTQPNQNLWGHHDLRPPPSDQSQRGHDSSTVPVNGVARGAGMDQAMFPFTSRFVSNQQLGSDVPARVHLQILHSQRVVIGGL